MSRKSRTQGNQSHPWDLDRSPDRAFGTWASAEARRAEGGGNRLDATLPLSEGSPFASRSSLNRRLPLSQTLLAKRGYPTPQRAVRVPNLPVKSRGGDTVVLQLGTPATYPLTRDSGGRVRRGLGVAGAVLTILALVAVMLRG